MRTRNKLNVKRIASLTKAGVYSDGGGLYVRVRPSGSRSWIFVRIVQGVRRELGLGSLFDVSLAEAREEANRLRQQFREGRDPVAERAADKRTARLALTFGEFAEPFIARMIQAHRNEKHRRQWLSTIRNYAADLYPVPINDVETKDILRVLEPIWLEKSETASRVRQRLEKILNAAKVEGHFAGDNPARLVGHLDQLLPRQPKSKGHHSALPYSDLPSFMVELRSRKGYGARALEFAILTAARTSETLGATWSEVDLEARVWTIPAHRMKAGEEHQVPLSAYSIELLKQLRPGRFDFNGRIFHNGEGSSLSNMAMLQVLRRMKRGEITVHGFRSTFRDWVGEETSHAREDAEMALAHQIGNKAERAYRRGRSLQKRRVMMQEWSDFATQKFALQKSGIDPHNEVSVQCDI